MSDNEREDDPTSQPRIDPEARERELAAKYPNRPRNHAPTFPFHSLYQTLFTPLNENRQPKNLAVKLQRRQVGPNVQSQSKTEQRRAIIERFISRWRQAVGDDIFPAFRLIMPDKDRERAMYGLKEKVLARYIIKILQIDRNSSDGWSLTNWKLNTRDQNKSGGDFPSRCYDVISKRSTRDKPGDMTIEEVNDQLDKLSASAKEEDQLPILRLFYQRMDADEMTWLIRIILRSMKVGATERTFLDVWHPDAYALYNVSSSLRRVCWDLWSPNIRLESEDRGIVHLMECFQPQLAFGENGLTLTKAVQKLRPQEDDNEFWIEEKLDGERMQLHMITEPDTTPGGKQFKFWSRKAKDYTYLYGSGFEDPDGSLTRHLKPAFADGVDNIILDGEMITWDAELDMVMPFGTLKSAAISEQRNPFAGKARPLFKVFDILLLNDTPLTRYTLRDRRRALERAVKSVHRRLELHTYQVGTKEQEIEDALRKMIEVASEGLVVKNPRSMYVLNDRNHDWIKVKPEYMTEFGESLDCVIVGGYYGSGRRGGGLSSFLCGLRVEESWAKTGEWHEDLFWSFFKVGGGLNANDYATIKHHTEGKWTDWDAKNPPSRYIELANDGRVQFERPDVWIKPQESVVVEVKAAQITQSDTFRVGKTLRFPRFVKLRGDKDWMSALSIEGLIQLQEDVEKARSKKLMEADQERKEKRRKLNSNARAQPLHVVGYGLKRETSSQAITLSAMSSTRVTSKTFRGLTFYIMTESTVPEKRSKPQLETLVKSHGGQIVQTHKPPSGTPVICIASRKTVKVASLEKQGGTNILKPAWLFDCIAQSQTEAAQGLDRFLVPFEPDRHLFYLGDDSDKDRFQDNVDEFGDSFARDTTVDEMKRVFENMGKVEAKGMKVDGVMEDLIKDDGYEQSRSNMFRGLRFYFSVPAQQHIGSRKDLDNDVNNEKNDNDNDQVMIDANDANDADDANDRPSTTKTTLATSTARFAGASLAATLTDAEGITHIIYFASSPSPFPDRFLSSLRDLRKEISTWPLNRIPRIVDASWIDACWEARTRVDEEGYAAPAR